MIPPSSSKDYHLSSDTSQALGTLVVVVLKARHLPTASSSRWTKQSPYVSCTLFSSSTPLLDSPDEDRDVMSIVSGRTTKKGSTESLASSLPGVKSKKTSLCNVPPPDRATFVARTRLKLEKERSKTLSTTTLTSTPEVNEEASTLVESPTQIGLEIEEAFDYHSALCTPPDPRGGQHPIWDAELRFPLSSSSSSSNSPTHEDGRRRMLNVEVWAKVGLGRKDRPLGSTLLDVSPVLLSGTMDIWLPLSLNGTQRGEIFLNLTFFATPPSCLIPHPSPLPPLPPPKIPSAINSLLIRNGIPLRIPSFNFNFFSKDGMTTGMMGRVVGGVSTGMMGRVVGGVSTGMMGRVVGGVFEGFRSVLKWGWANKD